jgi:hypothetical protein
MIRRRASVADAGDATFSSMRRKDLKSQHNQSTKKSAQLSICEHRKISPISRTMWVIKMPEEGGSDLAGCCVPNGVSGLR